MGDWFNDENFWERLYPILYPSQRFEGADEEIVALTKLARLKRGRVLDLCCGPGRHALGFAKRGFAVTGVDLSEFLLEKARERARASNLAIEWVREDMRDFVRPGDYDLVINLFTSFGYFAHQSDDMVALKNMAESVKEGGYVVIDTLGKEALAERLQHDRQPTEEVDGALLIQRVEVVDDWGRARSEWLLIRDNVVERFQFEHALYSGAELKERMNWAGLSEVKLYGSLDGRPYGPGARRLVAVGRK